MAAACRRGRELRCVHVIITLIAAHPPAGAQPEYETGMSILIRDVQAHELDAVLSLNNAAGRNILALDAAKLRYFYERATYFRVAVIGQQLAGFLIALDQDAGHDSPNFQWFRGRLDRFMYIDRIVIGKAHRGIGLGRIFYADVQSFTEVRSPRIACEVFLEPGNDIALLFHGTFGFHEAGQQMMPGVNRRVSMLVKDMCSWPWIEGTYYENGISRLPDRPWLAARTPCGSEEHRATGTWGASALPE